jgi:hypothetical protein
MDQLAFVPPTPGTPIKQSDWPTLGQMLGAGKRFVAFLDAGADSGAVNFLMPEFQMVWEPPFSVTDPAFPCKVDRIAGPLATEDHMYMINHNLNTAVFGDNDILVPDRNDIKTTNGLASYVCLACASVLATYSSLAQDPRKRERLRPDRREPRAVFPSARLCRHRRRQARRRHAERPGVSMLLMIVDPCTDGCSEQRDTRRFCQLCHTHPHPSWHRLGCFSLYISDDHFRAILISP